MLRGWGTEDAAAFKTNHKAEAVYGEAGGAPPIVLMRAGRE
jgi:hypothetical protein